jgi:two-component system sensor histidine kinase DevS
MPYKTFFEASSEALLIVNLLGTIVEANSRAAELFAYERQQLTGQKIEFLIPPRLREIHEQHRAEYFKTPRTRSMGTGLNLLGCRKTARNSLSKWV